MRLVIVGSGPGGVTAATTARTLDPNAEICILTREDTPAHRRPAVSLALTDPTIRQLYIEAWSPEELARRNKVRDGVDVIGGDVARRVLQVMTDGRTTSVEYDCLILATGGTPVLPEIPGVSLPGVFTIQTLADAQRASDALDTCQTAVVVGGGFSALEVAERLLTYGKTVHLVVRSRLMRRLLEPPMSEYLRNRLPDRLQLHQGLEPAKVLGHERAEGLLLGHKRLRADTIFMMTGVQPNTQLAQRLGLKLGRHGGISVSQKMETSVPGIYAVGDCVEMQDFLTGLPILMPTAGTAARGGRQAGASAVGSAHIYEDTSLRFQYERVFDTEIVCVGHSSETSSVDIRSSVIYDEDMVESTRTALVVSQEGRLIGGQVISSRMSGTIGYQLLKRVREGAVLEKQPLLKSRHTQLRSLVERTLGPIR